MQIEGGLGQPCPWLTVAVRKDGWLSHISCKKPGGGPLVNVNVNVNVNDVNDGKMASCLTFLAKKESKSSVRTKVEA